MSPFRAARGPLAVAALVWLAGCGGNPIAPPPPPPPPVPVALTCPAPVEVNSPEGFPVVVPYNAPVGTGQAPLTTTCTPGSDTLFPVGTTTVTCTVMDALNRNASCTFEVRVAGPPRLTHTRFLSFGDSITAGVVSPAGTFLLLSPSTAYPLSLETRLRARYRVQLPEVINDGLPGEYAATPNPDAGSPGGLRRFLAAIPYYRPEAVLIMEGTNDVNIFGQAGADDAIAALRQMVQHAKSQGLRVCLATIAPHRRPTAFLLPSFNQRIRELALAEEVVLVDIYDALDDNMPLYIGLDNLHPTVAGYDKMAETFFEAIRKNFELQPAGGLAFR